MILNKILLFVLISASLQSVQVPLARFSVINDSLWADTLYTFEVSLNDQKVDFTLDLRATNTWLLDKKCKNCFLKDQDLTTYYECQVKDKEQCKPEAKNFYFLGQKCVSAKSIPIQLNSLKLSDQELKVGQINDVVEVVASDNRLQAYMGEVDGGLNLSPSQSKKNLQSFVQSKGEKLNQFSIYINGEESFLIFGETNDFFKQNDSKFVTFKSQETSTSSWTLKVGPQIELIDGDKKTQISSQVSSQPSEDASKLAAAAVDTTTDNYILPTAVFSNLNIEKYDCQLYNGRHLCNCDKWPKIGLSLVKDQTKNGDKANLQQFVIPPENFLEKQKNGKCLLQLRPQQDPLSSEFILGTSFFELYYPVFNLDESTIAFADAYNFEPGNSKIGTAFFITFIVLACLLALLAIIGLLLLLKKIKLPQQQGISLYENIRNSGVKGNNQFNAPQPAFAGQQGGYPVPQQQYYSNQINNQLQNLGSQQNLRGSQYKQ